MHAAWDSIITDGWSSAVTILGDFAPIVALGVGLILAGWLIFTIRRAAGG